MSEIAQTLARDVANRYYYDTFLHYAEMNKVSQATGIGPDNPELLLDTWSEYHAATSLESYGRGNCVDFAKFGKRMLRGSGVEADIVGADASIGFDYTPLQRDFMGIEHVGVLVDGHKDPKFLQLCSGIPALIPIHSRGNYRVGEWDVSVDTADESSFTVSQFMYEPDEATTVRYLRQPLDDTVANRLTRDFKRIPRSLFLSTLQPSPFVTTLSYRPRTDTFFVNSFRVSHKYRLPFRPEDFGDDLNEPLSELFGFDVKKEVIDSIVMRNALPPTYWIGLAR